MRYAVIMAGGSGTRLWPMSRAGLPKQLLPFIRRGPGSAPTTLLHESARRIERLVPAERRYLCAGLGFRDQILSGLPGFTHDRYLAEPVARDTLNAVGFAAAVFASLDPDAVFAVLTADHLIEPQDAFERAVDAGFALVEADPARLVSFAITPDHPATGFGYIEDDGPIAPDPSGLAFRVRRFVEKPPLERAREYLASGRFSWNAGMFVFHARTFLSLLERHQPAAHAGLSKIARAWASPDRDDVIAKVYPTLPKTSVDYGVMEPASTDPAVTLCGVRMNVSWLDVGSWPSFAQTLTPDAQGNLASAASLHALDSTGNIVVADDPAHAVALIGCHDLIVIRTPSATLVVPKDRAQQIKDLHATLPHDLR